MYIHVHRPLQQYQRHSPASIRGPKRALGGHIASDTLGKTLATALLIFLVGATSAERFVAKLKLIKTYLKFIISQESLWV